MVIFSMSSVCPEFLRGTLVIPGRSIRVRSGHVLLKIVKIIGMSTIFLELPATLSVSSSMLRFTSWKSVNFLLGISSNIA